jgi:hypothetical protein
VSTRRSMTGFAAPSVSRSSHQVSFAMSRKRVVSGFGSVAFNTRITAGVLTGVQRGKRETCYKTYLQDLQDPHIPGSALKAVLEKQSERSIGSAAHLVRMISLLTWRRDIARTSIRGELQSISSFSFLE